MRKHKATQLSPRPAGFNRFQTAVTGLGFVPSAIGARFDPYSEPARHPQASREQMERVERVAVPEA
ncbi:MAG: hypothetical protein ACRD04_02390 [Terriglobales bacterium]